MHGFIAYGLFDEGRLVATFEIPLDVDFDLINSFIRARLGTELVGENLVLREVCRESTGANALNRIYGM